MTPELPQSYTEGYNPQDPLNMKPPAEPQRPKPEDVGSMLDPAVVPKFTRATGLVSTCPECGQSRPNAQTQRLISEGKDPNDYATK